MEYYLIEKMVMFAKIDDNYIKIRDFDVIDTNWSEPEEFKN